MHNLSSEPLVSIIVPMFNAETYISEALDSILRQSYKNIEIIVVDDGSTDVSNQVVLSYGNKVKYIYQKNSGGGSIPRNCGVSHSLGEFITFFDADDIMLPGKIERQVDFLKQHLNISVVLMDYVNFNEFGVFDKSHFKTCSILSTKLHARTSDSIILATDEARMILAIENYTSANSPLIKRDVINSIGLFDEDLKASEDFDLMYRISMNYEVGIINAIGFKRRLHNHNQSWNTVKILNNMIRSREKAINFEKNSLIRKSLKKQLSNFNIALSDYYISRDNIAALKKLGKGFLSNPQNLILVKTFFKIILAILGFYKNKSYNV